MSKYQLWSRDEYGQGSIHESSDEKNKLLETARKMVNEANVNNALTLDDKKRNWEAYAVDIFSEDGDEDDNYFYGGINNLGKHIAYDKSGNIHEIINNSISGHIIKIFLGHMGEEEWYAQDTRRKDINSVNHPDLLGKTVYFIKKVG